MSFYQESDPLSRYLEPLGPDVTAEAPEMVEWGRTWLPTDRGNPVAPIKHLILWRREYGIWIAPPRPILHSWLCSVRDGADAEFIAFVEQELVGLGRKEARPIGFQIDMLPKRTDPELVRMLEVMVRIEKDWGDVSAIPDILTTQAHATYPSLRTLRGVRIDIFVKE